MKNKMKVGFVSFENAAHLTSSSIHSYYEAKALQAIGLTVCFFGPLTLRRDPWLFIRRAYSRFFRGKRLLPQREPLVTEDFARQISEKLKEFPVDVIFSHGTIPIGGLDCPVPMVFWSDATFAGMVGFYPGFNNLEPVSLQHGNQMEQSALKRCSLAFYSSEWAARTCFENYKVDVAKVKVVPFGANLEKELPLQEIEKAIQARSVQTCNLAFVGTEWKRKGGNLALELTEALRRSGLQTELKIIGCRPPATVNLPDYVQVTGYMDTSTSSGQAAYQAQLARANFLVLPTRADCSPRVLYEAGAMGVPSLATNVGGIASIIEPEVNGGLFPPGEEFVEPAARFVLEAMQSAEYQKMAVRTIEYHIENQLWEKSTKKIETWLTGMSPSN